MEIKFAKFNKTQTAAVAKILKRAEELFNEANPGQDLDLVSLEMDISATHAHKPLDLSALLKADDFNFAHDVFGIMRHMNRQTGLLENCFLPRFAKRSRKSA